MKEKEEMRFYPLPLNSNLGIYIARFYEIIIIKLGIIRLSLRKVQIFHVRKAVYGIDLCKDAFTRSWRKNGQNETLDLKD